MREFCFLFDSLRLTRSRQRIFRAEKFREIGVSRSSFVYFSYLGGGSIVAKVSRRSLVEETVGKNQRSVGVFETGRTWQGKRRKRGAKKIREKNAVEAWRVHENVRDRGEERLDEGARSKGSWKRNVNLWDHVDRSHASVSLAFFFFYILSTVCILLASTCYSYVPARSIHRLFLILFPL